jgi:hypothetical protein
LLGPKRLLHKGPLRIGGERYFGYLTDDTLLLAAAHKLGAYAWLEETMLLFSKALPLKAAFQFSRMLHLVLCVAIILSNH